MPLEYIHRAPDVQRYDTPLLFVHGAWHGGWCWEPNFLPYFAQHGFDSYAMSLRGHGKSTPLRSVRWMRLRYYVEDVIDIADRIERETGKRPVVIGHSLGGYLVQKYLVKRRAPAAVLLATLPINGALGFALRTFRFIHHAPLTPLRMLASVSTYPLVREPRLVKMLFFSESMPIEDIEAHHPLIQNESVRTVTDSTFFDRVRPKKVDVIPPMLVVAAENDQVFTVREQRQTAAAWNADFALIEDLAHDAMLDTHWRRAADAIRDWLQQQAAAGRI